MAALDAGNQRSRHWVLSTLSDVAYLLTQIKFCREYNTNSERRTEIMQVLHLKSNFVFLAMPSKSGLLAQYRTYFHWNLLT